MNADSNTQKSVSAHPWVQLILGIVCMLVVANMQSGWINFNHGWNTLFAAATFNLVAAALGLLVLKSMRARHVSAIRADLPAARLTAVRGALQRTANLPGTGSVPRKHTITEALPRISWPRLAQTPGGYS